MERLKSADLRAFAEILEAGGFRGITQVMLNSPGSNPAVWLEVSAAKTAWNTGHHDDADVTLTLTPEDLSYIVSRRYALMDLQQSGLVTLQCNRLSAQRQLLGILAAYHALAPVQVAFEADFLPIAQGASEDPRHIPIIINNFNRCASFFQLVDFLRSTGHSNLYVIDNASTYPPLLEQYAKEKLRVFHLRKNIGCFALWKTRIAEYFLNNYYVYTDPDVVPTESCPNDFMTYFKNILDRSKGLEKVGFALKVDDLPDWYELKAKVIAHESQFQSKRIDGAGNLFDAPIDTTFALYRPHAQGGYWLSAIRTGEPYVARHLPWYSDTRQHTAEERYYRAAAIKPTHWTRLERMLDLPKRPID